MKFKISDIPICQCRHSFHIDQRLLHEVINNVAQIYSVGLALPVVTKVERDTESTIWGIE